MSRKRDLPTAKKSEGTICYGSEILTNIITFAVDEADGVAIYPSKKPISYVFDKDGLIIDVDVKINYNLSVSEIAYKIQDSIKIYTIIEEEGIASPENVKIIPIV